jgi:HSP20 family protein
MSEVKVKKEKGKEGEALVRWPRFDVPLFRGSLFSVNPFTLMKRFAEEMDRAFGAEEVGLWAPTVEIKEMEGKLVVSADLPGLKKEDVKVEVTPEALVVEGERKQEKEEKKEGYYHSERSYGRFYRSIPLPEGAELDKAAAEFTNGVLEVSIPIPKAQSKRREIPVNEVPKPKAA